MESDAGVGAEGVHGARAMVAAGHRLAVEAAGAMLRAGGSAVDAAIAADAVMGVVEPMASGVGGDMLAMVVRPDGTPVSYNGTGRAPAGLEAALVEALPDGRIPERHPYTVTVPGAVRGWHDMHHAFGRLAWADLFAPAIAAASDGFHVAPVCAREWSLFAKVLLRDPAAAALYRAAQPPVAGERFANAELAGVLREIAADGPDAFYLGAPARAASAHVQRLGGVLAESDFAAHTGNFCPPVSTRFRGLTVLECPPNTHGIAVLHALDALEPLALDPADPRTTVAIVDAMREAARHAQKTVADPSGNTVCTVVVDEDGLAVSLMTSVFKRFGSGIAAPGCGFVLQNRGFGFSKPGQLNGPAPGKRPFHTVVPGAALHNGRFHAAFGVVGGAMQPQGQLQILLRTAAWSEPLQQALDAPRWRLETDVALALEAGFPEHHAQALRQAGYVDLRNIGELGGRSDFGGAQWVMRHAAGHLVGASDKRKDGLAQGF